MTRLWCWLVGHRPYKWAHGDYDMLEFRDALGAPLVRCRICQRCRAVYWEVV